MDDNGTATTNGTDDGGTAGAGISDMPVPEAAARSGLSDRAIRRALTEGRLQGYRVAGRWMVNTDDLARYGRMARHQKERPLVPSAPGANGTDGTDRAALADVLRAVVDGAVIAEVRAQVAEARVRELEAVLADLARRRWWRGGGSRAMPATAVTVAGQEPIPVTTADHEPVQVNAEAPVRRWWPWGARGRSV